MLTGESIKNQIEQLGYNRENPALINTDEQCCLDCGGTYVRMRNGELACDQCGAPFFGMFGSIDAWERMRKMSGS